MVVTVFAVTPVRLMRKAISGGSCRLVVQPFGKIIWLRILGLRRIHLGPEVSILKGRGRRCLLIMLVEISLSNLLIRVRERLLTERIWVSICKRFELRRCTALMV